MCPINGCRYKQASPIPGHLLRKVNPFSKIVINWMLSSTISPRESVKIKKETFEGTLQTAQVIALFFSEKHFSTIDYIIYSNNYSHIAKVKLMSRAQQRNIPVCFFHIKGWFLKNLTNYSFVDFSTSPKTLHLVSTSQ